VGSPVTASSVVAVFSSYFPPEAEKLKTPLSYPYARALPGDWKHLQLTDSPLLDAFRFLMTGPRLAAIRLVQDLVKG